MNLNTIITNIANALDDNTDLQAWCEVTYGQAPYIFVSPDEREAGKSNQTPLIALLGFGKENSRGDENQPLAFRALCEVYDAGRTVVNPARPNLIFYDGGSRLEELVTKVVAVIVGVDLAGGMVERISTEFRPVANFPFYQAELLVEILKPYAVRESRWL